MTHFDDKYFTVEFYHGVRGSFYGSRGIEDVTATAAKCSRRGGICFILPSKYERAIWKFIETTEHERSPEHVHRGVENRIFLDFFRGNIPVYVNDVDTAD
ncbi:hypothetical protein FACS1894208_00570 [Clostridia bacterium]|nr:hypothetical protein FACS1894208_00570 [Clostridia bacterium]